VTSVDHDGQRQPRTGPLPLTVLCGFLGAGKTTVLKRLLRECGSRRYAVIVNDLSELTVDAELIEEAREGRGETIIALNGGSLGGAQRAPFRDALAALEQDETIDYLLVETSGGTHPDAMIQEIEAHSSIRLDAFVTVVDGLNLLRDHDCGRALLVAGIARSNTPLGLLHAQIAAASVLLVSKADLLTRAQADAVLQSLRRLNAQATIVTMAYGSVRPELVTETGSFRSHPAGSPRAGAARSVPRPAATDDDPGAFDLGSDVLADVRPFHPQRLYTLFTQRLPLGVHRSKGWLWLASRPMDVLLWNQAGSYFGLEWVATWKAGVLIDPEARLFPEERAALAERLAQTHPVFGDRHIELTVIGAARDRAVFLRELQTCLCTDDEVAAWRDGMPFDDPWPRTIRRV
jgi:G3E family GTPase